MRNGKPVLAEVGVGPLSMCYSRLFYSRQDAYFDLFEPHPEYCKALRADIADKPNVTLHEVAVGDEPGTFMLYDEGTSSSLVGVASPSQQHKGDHARQGYEVAVRRMSDFDKGDIDHLRVDTEGAEWFCLKHLVSRPEQIVVEVYNDLATYINPFLYEIELWAEREGYVRAAVKDSDFIYARKGGPKLVLEPAPVNPIDYVHVQWEEEVKRTLIGHYVSTQFARLPADTFVTTLHRLFQRKRKVIANLASYVHGQVAKGRDPQRVLSLIGFFAGVLTEAVDANLSQPLLR